MLNITKVVYTLGDFRFGFLYTLKGGKKFDAKQIQKSKLIVTTNDS